MGIVPRIGRSVRVKRSLGDIGWYFEASEYVIALRMGRRLFFSLSPCIFKGHEIEWENYGGVSCVAL